MDSRISVLGISYEGSERIALADGLDSGEMFTATLDFPPANASGNENADGEDIIDAADVVVVNMVGLAQALRLWALTVESLNSS